MKRNELVNKHVVKAISVGLSAMMAMSPVSALAAEVTPEPVAPTPTEVPTSIPAVTIAPAEVIKSVPAQPAPEKSNEAQLSDAKKEIAEAVDATGAVKTPILKIPLEAGAKNDVIVAGGYVAVAEEALSGQGDAVGKDIDKKLDKSNGEENVGEKSKIDDAVIKELQSAKGNMESYVEKINEAINVAEEAMKEVETSEDAAKVEEVLTAAKDAAQEELDNAQTDMNEAAAELVAAQQAYDEAAAISEDAAEDALEALNVAKDKVAKAKERTDAVASQLGKIDDMLDNLSNGIDSTQDALEDAIEKAEDELDVATGELKDLVDDLKDQTKELGGAVSTFVGEVEDLGDAIVAFGQAVKTAKDSEDAVKEMRQAYYDAKQALEKAQTAYDTAFKNGEVSEEDVKNLNDALLTASDAVYKAEIAMEAIKDEVYAEKLQNAINEKDNETVGSLVIGKYLADGKEVKWIPANINEDGSIKEDADTSYGKSAEGFYVVLSKDIDGNEVVESRYGYSVGVDEEGKEILVINELQGDTVNFYQVGIEKLPIETKEVDGQTVTFVTNKAGEELIIKKDAADKAYYEKEIGNTSRVEDDLDLFADTVVLDSEVLKSLVPGTIGSALDHYLGVKITFNRTSMKAISPNVYETSIGGKYLNLPIRITKVGNDYEVEYKLGSGSWNKFNTAVISKDEIVYQKKTIYQVKVGNDSADVLYDEEKGFYYVNADGSEVALVEVGENTYAEKISVSYIDGGSADTTYTNAASTNFSSDTYNVAYNGAVTAWQSACQEQQTALNEWNTASDSFDAQQKALKDLADANLMLNGGKDAEGKDVEGVDLQVKRVIGNNEITYGDLAELPVTILELVQLDKILSMPKEDRDDIVSSLETIASSKNDVEKAAALVKVIAKMGGTDSEAYVALTVALSTGFVDDKVEDLAKELEKIPFVGKGLADALRETAKNTEAATPYQQKYAQAWVAAMQAKGNVVLKGIALVEQAGDTVSAGIGLIEPTIKEGKAISDVTMKALEVSIRAAAVGGMKMGDSMLTVTGKLVGYADQYVETMRAKADTAAKEVTEAQNALNNIQIQNPRSQELAEAAEALAKAKQKFAEAALELRAAEAKKREAEALAKEAEDLANKLAEEEAAKNQPTDGSGATDGTAGGGTTGGSSSGTAGGAATIQNATVITDEDMELFAQAVADQVVLGARSTRNASAVKTTEGAGEAKEEIKGAGAGEEEITTSGVEEEEVVTIEDEETALAAALPTAEERAKMSWWWLLIVLICGATGYTWYRNHQKKIEGEDLEG